MGMFDYIEIDYPISIEKWVPSQYATYAYHTFGADGFQTKDLDCLLNYYYIDNNGFLYINKQSSWFEKPNTDDNYEKIYFHGHMGAYTSVWIDDPDDEHKGPMLWFEYDLKFTDGMLVRATMISPTIEDINELHRNL